MSASARATARRWARSSLHGAALLALLATVVAVAVACPPLFPQAAGNNASTATASAICERRTERTICAADPHRLYDAVCSERCPSGLRSATGNRVRAERCVAGSNPALSAWKARPRGPSFVTAAKTDVAVSNRRGQTQRFRTRHERRPLALDGRGGFRLPASSAELPGSDPSRFRHEVMNGRARATS